MSRHIFCTASQSFSNCPTVVIGAEAPAFFGGSGTIVTFGKGTLGTTAEPGRARVEGSGEVDERSVCGEARG
jgi:hypothetical protein